jgi:peptidoglycan/xylan/chitin deacetylase (PgdA/CDA1 family)
MARIRLRYPGGLCKALTFSYDDGVQTDFRLVEIMKKNGLKGTFNLNSDMFAPEGTVYPAGQAQRRMTYNEALACFKDSGMEVALHGADHPFWERLPENVCVRDIIRDREQLEEMFGTIIRGAAYPFGTNSDMTVEALRVCGIKYCRTVVSTGHFGLPTDWLRMPATCHHNDPRLMDLARAFVETTQFNDPPLFYVWGHSYEFDALNNWNVIEEFAEYIGNRSDIWYATNIEVYDYIEAFNSLQFSAAGTRVYNPTLIDVWFVNREKLYSVKSGETVELD